MKARRWWGWPLVPVYWAGLWVKDGLRAIGVLRVRRLGWPVVSVGSLSAGGAGKTPVVIALAELLLGRGWGVDVLSRGYGRMGRGVERVDVEAMGAAGRFGDEPVLIAQRVGVPVWVGAERFAAGVAAEDGCKSQEDVNEGVPQRLKPRLQDDSYGIHSASLRTGSKAVPLGKTVDLRKQSDAKGYLHLLDDGFQHRGLVRALDVVVVTAEDLEDALLPAGNRREGLGALRRADAVVVREEEWDGVVARLKGKIRGDAVIWGIRRGIGFAEVAVLGPADTRRYIVFCAIARPVGFVEMLREAGVYEPEVVPFADHHAYTLEDMDRLVEVCGRSGGCGFITTEKDAVKLSAAMRSRLEEAGPLVVARLDCRFVDEAEVMRAVEARIR